jgi:hypothetical protein
MAQAPVIGKKRKDEADALATANRGTSSLRINLNVPASGAGLNLPRI